MRTLIIPNCVCVLSIFVAASLALAQESDAVNPPLESGLNTVVAELRESLSDATAMTRAKAKDSQRVSALVRIVNEESSPKGNNALKHRALRELVRYSESVEAIDVLLREIRFEPPQLSSKDPLATYSAASSLTKMGVKARSRVLKAGLGKPLSDPELYLRGVVAVMLDSDEGEWSIAKEITLKRIKHLVETVEKQPAFDDSAQHKAAILFNLKRVMALMDDPSFSAGRIPDSE